MCEVTIVIPNYNGEKYLWNCVDSIYANTKVPFKLIVVDNGSTDKSISQIERSFPKAEVIRLDKNYGFCRAVNEGIRKSNTPYVLLLNNDTVIRIGFVEQLLRAIKKDKKIFSVEAKMLQYMDPSLIDSAGTYYNAFGWAFSAGKDKPVFNYRKRKRTFSACAGAAIYRKELFRSVGLFDETHFAYLEDVDIGYRARIMGYKNVYEPTAEVIHIGSASSGSRYNEFKVKYSSRNNIYLIYKNMPLFQTLINFPLLCIGFGIKAVFFSRKGFGLVYLRGLLDGIALCKRDKKVKFQPKNLKNYIKIQIELWINLFRRLF